MVEVKRKKSETFEALVRRFGKKIQQSGRLLQVRKVSYHNPKKNKTALRATAARRQKISAEREYKRKIGILEEEPRHRRR